MKKVSIIVVVAMVSGLTFAGTNIVVPVSKGNAFDAIKNLCTKIQVQCLLRQVNPDREQLGLLLDISRQAIGYRVRFEDAMQRILEQQLEAFAKFKEEDIINTGFSHDVERETSVANHRGKAAFKRFADAVNVLEEKVSSILDPGQLSQISSFSEGRFNPGRLFRLLRETNRRNRVEAGHTRQIETGIDDDGPDANKMTDRERLKQIHREKYGYIGPVGRFILLKQTYEVLSRLNGTKPDNVILTGKSYEAADYKKRVSDMRKEINLLNLINGMNFSSNQLVRLAEIAERAGDFERPHDIFLQLDPKIQLDIIENLREISAYLDRGSIVPEGVIHEVKRLYQKAIASRLKPFKHQPYSREEQYTQLVSSVDEILFDNQKETLIGYTPCLIPPKDLKDPVRVGQAADNTRYTRMLDKVRRMVTPGMYEKNKEFVLDQIITMSERNGKFTDEEIAANKEVLDSVITKVIAMSDAEYEMNKGSFAEDLRVLDVEETLKERLRNKMGDELILAQKIRTFLLDPAIAPLLRMRYKQLTEECRQEKTDLDSIEPAENCEKGCALN